MGKAVTICYLCSMEKIGSIEIKITGSKGNLDLSPDNYDIRELITMLGNAEDLLYSGDKKDRPVISYGIEEGSVKHIFKTSMQFIIGFNAVIGQVNRTQNIDFLDIKTAKAFENIQDIAIKKNYAFGIKTSLNETNEIKLDKTTHFYRTEAVWADAEFYFYGKITNAGGKDKTNIHINTDEFGSLTIFTPVSFFENLDENIIHKNHFGIRANGKQHSETGELDKSSLKFMELVDYQPKYDEIYLNNLIEKASKKWSNIGDKDAWLRNIRGDYEG